MKKLLIKDKKLRLQYRLNEKQIYILKSIFKNFNFFMLIRWKAFLKLKDFSEKSSKISVSNRCVFTANKKRFNKLTFFSRHVFLKQIRNGQITGFQKSSW